MLSNKGYAIQDICLSFSHFVEIHLRNNVEDLFDSYLGLHFLHLNENEETV